MKEECFISFLTDIYFQFQFILCWPQWLFWSLSVRESQEWFWEFCIYIFTLEDVLNLLDWIARLSLVPNQPVKWSKAEMIFMHVLLIFCLWCCWTLLNRAEKWKYLLFVLATIIIDDLNSKQVLKNSPTHSFIEAELKNENVYLLFTFNKCSRDIFSEGWECQGRGVLPDAATQCKLPIICTVASIYFAFCETWKSLARSCQFWTVP